MNQTAEDAVKELVTIFMHRAQISMSHSEDHTVDTNLCKLYDYEIFKQEKEVFLFSYVFLGCHSLA